MIYNKYLKDIEKIKTGDIVLNSDKLFFSIIFTRGIAGCKYNHSSIAIWIDKYHVYELKKYTEKDFPKVYPQKHPDAKLAILEVSGSRNFKIRITDFKKMLSKSNSISIQHVISSYSDEEKTKKIKDFYFKYLDIRINFKDLIWIFLSPNVNKLRSTDNCTSYAALWLQFLGINLKKARNMHYPDDLIRKDIGENTTLFRREVSQGVMALIYIFFFILFLFLIFFIFKIF